MVWPVIGGLTILRCAAVFFVSEFLFWGQTNPQMSCDLNKILKNASNHCIFFQVLIYELKIFGGHWSWSNSFFQVREEGNLGEALDQEPNPSTMLQNSK